MNDFSLETLQWRFLVLKTNLLLLIFRTLYWWPPGLPWCDFTTVVTTSSLLLLCLFSNKLQLGKIPLTHWGERAFPWSERSSWRTDLGHYQRWLGLTSGSPVSSGPAKTELLSGARHGCETEIPRVLQLSCSEPWHKQPTRPNNMNDELQHSFSLQTEEAKIFPLEAVFWSRSTTTTVSYHWSWFPETSVSVDCGCNKEQSQLVFQGKMHFIRLTQRQNPVVFSSKTEDP